MKKWMPEGIVTETRKLQHEEKLYTCNSRDAAMNGLSNTHVQRKAPTIKWHVQSNNTSFAKCSTADPEDQLGIHYGAL